MSIINQYADVILASMIAPRGLFIPGIADVDEWSLAQKQSYLAQQPMKKDPNKVYIVHAAGAAWKKGSAIISALLEDCRAKGLPIENIFLQTKPEKARPFFALADFVVEQVGVGTFGLLGVEMMTWEIPILCYHTDLWDRIRDYPPVLKITKEGFGDQIARCVEMKKSGELVEFGKKCRRWVKDHLEISTQGLPRYLDIYSKLIRGEPVPQLINRSWFTQEARMRRGEKSDFYVYMLKNRVFDKIGIDVPEYDRRLYR